MTDMFQTDMTWLAIEEEEVAPSTAQTWRPVRKGLYQLTEDTKQKIRASLRKLHDNPANSESLKRLDQVIQRYEAGTLMQVRAKKPQHGKPVQTPFGRYDTIQCAVATGRFSYKIMMKWMASDPQRFYWLPLPPKKVRKPVTRKSPQMNPGAKNMKGVHTPFGDFMSMIQAARAWGVPNAYKKLQKELRTNPEQFYYTKDTK